MAINDVIDSATMARLLRYDSTFGPLRRDVEDLGDASAVDGHNGTGPDVTGRQWSVKEPPFGGSLWGAAAGDTRWRRWVWGARS